MFEAAINERQSGLKMWLDLDVPYLMVVPKVKFQNYYPTHLIVGTSQRETPYLQPPGQVTGITQVKPLLPMTH